jgi:hypothetical protein
MKPITTEVVEGRKYNLVPQPQHPQCGGCEAFMGFTASGRNLCTALGDDCTDELKCGWVEDKAYVHVPEAVSEEAVDGFNEKEG